MRRIAYMLPGLVILLAGLLLAGPDEKDGKRAERRLLKLEARAKKISITSQSSTFLQQETQRLLRRAHELGMERSRTFSNSSYEFDRILEAVDDLLDAREDLQAATQDRPPDSKEEGRGGTAKRLERAYFRVQQGAYFAGLSGDKHASEYVPLARQFYQRARAAYDAQEYWRANKLASASSELVNVLENLAQAAVRRPEPPVLK